MHMKTPVHVSSHVCVCVFHAEVHTDFPRAPLVPPPFSGFFYLPFLSLFS